MILLDKNRLEGALEMREAIDLLEAAALHEAAGKTVVSPRLNSHFDTGWMRILFAVDSASGYFAAKSYHMIQGIGVRYVILLYTLDDGALVALLDGRTITDLRTGAASGVVARKVEVDGPVSIGVIGAGYQARAQLASLATVYEIDSAAVFSPTAASREKFAREMTAELGFPVTPVTSGEIAVRGRAVVAAASSNRGREPSVQGAWLDGCRLLCAVGSTRIEQVEADAACFRRSQMIVVDTLGAREESGDLRQLADADIADGKLVTMAQWVSGQALAPKAGLIAFKSLGTALQDLALAVRCYEKLRDAPGVLALPELASLKSKASDPSQKRQS